MNKKRIKEYIKTIQEISRDPIFQEKYTEGDHSFERVRKLPFENVVLYTIGNTKLPFPEAAEQLTKYVKADSVSGAALCKARKKVSGEAFREIQERCASVNDRSRKYHGYNLIAVDGMTGELPNIKEFREKYVDRSSGNTPQFLAVSAYDILNEIFLMSEFHFGIGDEREMSLSLIERMRIRYPEEKQIWIFDRGYPSAQLLKTLITNGIHFVIRVTNSFLKEVNEFVAGKKNDDTVFIDLDKKRIAANRINIDSEFSFELRCVRVDLNKSEEILITNLPKAEFPRRCMKSLYGYRWEIEVSFNYLKNSVYVEEFTAKSENGILQDFYSTLIMQNMITHVCSCFSPSDLEET